MKRALITGISGFVGTHLSRHLMDAGWQIAGYDLAHPDFDVDFFKGDICDKAGLSRALENVRPDVVFHLAGIIKSNTPDTYYQAHVLGTVDLLDTVMGCGLQPVVLIASSSAVYGSGLGSRPITENFTPRPATHYGVSKLAQELAALHYFTAFGLPVIVVRAFNLLGPGLSPVLACSAFAMQIAQVERSGKSSTISTGNLSSRRDFLDVRDAVRVYALLAEKGQAGQAYNVASGQATAISECLDFLRKQAKVPVDAVVDLKRLQRNDIPVQAGSIKRVQTVTGWEPEISKEQSLMDLLDDWRQRMKTE